MQKPLRRTASLIAAGLSAAAVAWPAAAQQTQPYYGPHMWHGGWHGWVFGPLMMILFVAVVVAAVVLLVRWLGGAPHGAAPSARPASTPLDILKERFARGEIDAQEFEERRRVLGD